MSIVFFLRVTAKANGSYGKAVTRNYCTWRKSPAAIMLFPHHRHYKKMKGKCEEHGSADSDAPKDYHPLQVVQKTVMSI
ncbi:hypothetical protein LJR034_005317 [Caballeronia sp. LjRoot34]|uniref:hypothetical protein n=1 Tax=Caballeronia sp. LjRoot34 TaxID=3342325 RepID=UPI003ED0C6BB